MGSCPFSAVSPIWSDSDDGASSSSTARQRHVARGDLQIGAHDAAHGCQTAVLYVPDEAGFLYKIEAGTAWKPSNRPAGTRFAPFSYF